MSGRIIALADCNSFYASCEKIFRPDLAGRPVVVLSNNDGCIVALTEDAKKLGILRGAPLFEVEEIIKKNNIAVFSSNYELYGDMSDRVMSILREFSPDVEVYSIDEAFLDLTGFSHKDLHAYCREIKNKVQKCLGLPISIGIGTTKTQAKLANSIGKKYKCYHGIFDIRNTPNIDRIYESTKISDIWGVGPAYSKMLAGHNINSVKDFIAADPGWIKKNMTTAGWNTQNELKGTICYELHNDNPEKKCIVSSRSFSQPVSKLSELRESLGYHITLACEKMRRQNTKCRFVSVFIMTNNFKENTPQYNNSITITLDRFTNYQPDIIDKAMEGLDMIYREGYEFKKLGIALAEIKRTDECQLNLFDDHAVEEKKTNLIRTIDRINAFYGKESLRVGTFNYHKNWVMKRNMKSPSYTTAWSELPIVKTG